jgi:hypothetical protein
MGGSGPTDMDMDEVDMHIPYPDLATFGNFALASLATLPAFESADAKTKTKTEERRSGAMVVNFMLDV